MESKQLVIHDISCEEVSNYVTIQEDANLIDSNQVGNHCIGCFNCWVKHPGVCTIKDGHETIGARIAACEELVLVSRCVYGGFSPEVKKVLDRCIGGMLPFFRIGSDGRMHHVPRYKNQIKLSVYFYGENITKGERETAKELVERNAANLNAKSSSVHFCRIKPSAGLEDENEDRNC